MTQRRLDVIHVLIARGEGDARQFLFYPHPKWSAPESGKPFLALPTKKLATGRESSSLGGGTLRRALAAVLSNDLGLVVRRPAWERRLPRVTLQTCSPTHGVSTIYTIWPVVMPVEAARPGALRARLRGTWLTAGEALRRRLLSPTARAVLGRRTVGEPASRPTAPARDDWTMRLADARAGDVGAFGPLFEEMKPWLTARLRTCCHTRALSQVPDEVEDALHDAAVNALAHLAAFDPDRGSAGTWLWTLTRNCAVTILRRRGSRPTVSLFHDDGRPACDLAAGGDDPAALAEQREELTMARRWLDRALALCGPEVRLAWELRHLHGKRYAEIAAAMGQPQGTIATWIFRVKKVARGLAAEKATRAGAPDW